MVLALVVLVSLALVLSIAHAITMLGENKVEDDEEDTWPWE